MSLKRSINLTFLALYGIGAILGAGIYVLIGEVAASSGLQAPLAFVLAGVVALVTGLSYAELSSRFPLSAGEAVYAQEAFGITALSRLCGLLVVFTGIVSTATLAAGFVGYFQLFIDLPRPVILLAFTAAICLVAIKGIRESIWVIGLITLLETGGLLLVIGVAAPHISPASLTASFSFSPTDFTAISGICLGAFIAFFAFIGFEDMVNVAEEIIEPEKNLPRGIFIAIGVSTLLYLLVAVAAVAAVPLEQLAGHGAPLALVLEHNGYSPVIITLISLVAVINGALVQLIMASRVLYGQARLGQLPGFLGDLHKNFATPHKAILLCSLVILLLPLLLPLAQLARTTSFIVLIVFCLVNISLIKIKASGIATNKALVLPGWVPVLGLLLCLGMLASQLIIAIG